MSRRIIKARGWTTPKISPKGTNAQNVGDHSYVWFRYWHQGKWSNPIRRKPSLSKPYSKESHLLDLKALVKAIVYKLEKENWNPVTNETPQFDWRTLEIGDQVHYLRQINFSEALDFAFEKKKPDLSFRSIQGYLSHIKYLKLAAIATELHNLPMSEFRLTHYRTILEQVRVKQNLTPSGYNIYRSFLSALVSEMIQWEIVEFNLVGNVKTKAVEKRFCHRPPTKEQRVVIMGKIKNEYPNFYRFLSVLYGCTLRPVEITRLQIKHLHMNEGLFRLPAHYAKDKTERDVIVPDWVLNLLKELELENFPKDYYIFSKGFLPGIKQLGINTARYVWTRIVKEGLGIDVNLYSLKKLAGNDMVRIQRNEGAANLLELPRIQMGHSSTDQTEVYVTEHSEILNELIKKKMPVL